ncbi:hypothetical protein JYU34_015561 [Plutella xylostella]|uniref:Uncharacterized protein n=1 Tax=Plutella xylostella TaxID=51655 RepID=A0ABQ7Q465_PLUXY|nr:hypothetical protein JYU34_015561 [Plutella xylostella]
MGPAGIHYPPLLVPNSVTVMVISLASVMVRETLLVDIANYPCRCECSGAALDRETN